MVETHLTENPNLEGMYQSLKGQFEQELGEKLREMEGQIQGVGCMYNNFKGR